MVFINPLGDGKWCKFDDDVVSRCTKKEAIEQNFGGDGDDTTAVRHCTNAYMLVYIQQSRLPEILSSVGEDDIPEALSNRLQEEKKLEGIKRKEKAEAYLYMTVRIALEDSFYGHQGNDLFDENANVLEFRVKKSSTLKEFMSMLSEEMKFPVDRMRPWSLQNRTNNTLRPSLIEIEDGNKIMSEVAENQAQWLIYLEMMTPEQMSPALPAFDKDKDVMLFFKYYDPAMKKLHYVGHLYLSISTKLSSILPKLCQMANIPSDSKLLLWEEIKPNLTEQINDVEQPLEHILEELMDGDIMIYQLEIPEADQQEYELPTASAYFKDLFYKVEINFCDKNKPLDQGFTLELSQRINYDQLAKRVAQFLNTDPCLLQFFKTQSYRDGPGQPLRCNFEGTLKDIIQFVRPKQVRRVYYQQLQISISELENKKQFKCIWISSNLKEEKEIVLYPNRNAIVTDLYEEAGRCAQIQLDANGSGRLRLIEIVSNRVHNIIPSEMTVETLLQQAMTAPNKSFRLEEIAVDELDIQDGDYLLPVAHFSKEVYTTFGSPFMIKIKKEDTVDTLRARLQDRLGVPDKEWEKYRVALVIQTKAHYLDEDDKIINFKDLRGLQQGIKPWIGLEHLNKGGNKRTRYCTEKAIKIYN